MSDSGRNVEKESVVIATSLRIAFVAILHDVTVTSLFHPFWLDSWRTKRADDMLQEIWK